MPTDHARPGPRPAADDAPAARAPTHAERCRTLTSGARSAALGTVSREPPDFPYVSLVTVGFDPRGRPLFLLSELAEHTQNLKARPEASALVTEPLDGPEPLAVGRVTLIGPVGRVPDADIDAVRGRFLQTNPGASYYVDFKDFAFYRLEPAALRYVGGFGRMSWVSAEDYAAAEPDPLASESAGILAHMNDDHADAVLAYARGLARVLDAASAKMTSVDRYGFDLSVQTPAGPRAVRLAYDEPVATTDDVRRAMVGLVKRARAALPPGP